MVTPIDLKNGNEVPEDVSDKIWQAVRQEIEVKMSNRLQSILTLWNQLRPETPAVSVKVIPSARHDESPFTTDVFLQSFFDKPMALPGLEGIWPSIFSPFKMVIFDHQLAEEYVEYALRCEAGLQKYPNLDLIRRIETARGGLNG